MSVQRLVGRISFLIGPAVYMLTASGRLRHLLGADLAIGAIGLFCLQRFFFFDLVARWVC